MLRTVMTIRIWLVVALTFLMLGTSCAPASAPSSSVDFGPVIKVEPSVSPVQVNDTVRVPITIGNVANLTAIEMHLSFNANVLEVVEVNNGGLIKADFVVQNTFDNTAGTIDYAVAQINRAPAKGSGTLLEIVFLAKASGESPISFRETQAAPAGALLSDSNGTAIQVSLTEANVSVNKP